MRQALVYGSLVECIGALTMGALVSKTISKGIIVVDDYKAEPELFATAMVGVLLGASATTFLATVRCGQHLRPALLGARRTAWERLPY
jgi:phosphate/sulfate permease